MMELFLNALASGLAQGGIYALIGVGLALIFGAMHVVNLAHGEVLVAGALLTYLLAGAGLPLWGAILLGGGLGGLL
ncbi:ABC transporter permease subunit, partial [Klebsiella pneumoniae]